MKHSNQNKSDKIRNIPAFIKSYSESKTGERVRNMRGNNILATKLLEKARV